MSELKQIGKYAILEILGIGGMGSVYLAQDTVIRRQVAIKVMSEATFGDETARKRFLQEAQAIGQLQHSSIIMIYDAGEYEKRPYLVVEYLKGHDLGYLIKEKTLPPTTKLLDHIIDICEALEYSHKNGIVHRDIKPGNIFICDDGSVRLMDFGIAKLQDGGLTKTGTLLGTINYMSPEQIHGEDIDYRTDLFSLGIVLFECFSFKRPFEGESMTAVMSKILFSDPDPFKPIDTEIPPVLNAVIQKALTKNREERYQDASELALDLTKVKVMISQMRMQKQKAAQALGKETSPIDMDRDRTNQRQITPDTEQKDIRKLMPSQVAEKTESTRRPLIMVLVAIFALGSLIGGGYYFLKGGISRSPSLKPTIQEVQLPTEPALDIAATRPDDHDPSTASSSVQTGHSVMEQPTRRQGVDTGQSQRPQKSSPTPKTAATTGASVSPGGVAADSTVPPPDQSRNQQSAEYLVSITAMKGAENNKDWQGVIDAANKALARNPGDSQAQAYKQRAQSNLNSEIERRTLIAAALNEGRNALRNRDYTAAIAASDRVLARDPGNEDARRIKQEALSASQSPTAIPIPTDYLSLAQSACDQGQWQSCLSYANTLLSTDKNNAEAQRLRSMAEDALHPASPGSGSANVSLLKLQGQHSFSKGNYEECIQKMTTILASNPQDDFALSLKAKAEAKLQGDSVAVSMDQEIETMKSVFQRGDYSKARDLAEKILSLKPTQPDALAIRSQSQQKLSGQKNSQEKQSDIATVRHHLGSGNYPQALQLVKNLQKDYPTDSEIKDLATEVQTAWANATKPTPTPLPALRIVHSAEQSTLSGKKYSLKVDIEGYNKEMIVTLFYRSTQKSEFKSIPMKEKRTQYYATIEGRDVRQPALEYFVVVTTPTNVVLYNGESEEVFRVKVTKEAPGSVPFF